MDVDLVTAVPLNAHDVKRVFVALGIDTPGLDREGYSLDQLLTELVESNDAIRAVEVHKHRVRYVIGGCTAELTVSDRGLRHGPRSSVTMQFWLSEMDTRRSPGPDRFMPPKHGFGT